MSGLTRGLAVATAVALALGLAPAGAASAATAEATVRGTVTANGHVLPGVRVGTWSPTQGQIATTVTDSRGEFALRSPSGVPVDLWAGTAPTADHAVFQTGGQHLVRGVIGRTATRGVASPLWQRVDPAIPGRLAGGRAIHLQLQRAGRFTSTTAEGGDGSISLVRGQDTSSTLEARHGRIDSGWLVPGAYRLRWNPADGRLPTTTTIHLLSGRTAVKAPTLPSARR